MDDRFPAYLRLIVKKLHFIALPNLGMLLGGLAAITFLMNMYSPLSMERFMFDPDLVMAGEWWRLFTFPFTSGFQSPLMLLFYVLYVFFVMNALETAWGVTPLTIFVLFTYLCVLGGAFLTHQRADVSFLIMQNVSLAFGTLFPNFELLLYFVLPVKAKWLSMLAGALLLLKFIQSGMDDRIFMVICLVPYFVFFGPILINAVKQRYRISKNRQKFRNDDMWR